MANDYLIMKAVEHVKLPVKFKKQYPTLGHLRDAGWWLQRKYDGCFGIATSTQMRSRTGEDYTKSCGHIVELIEPGYVVLGEVWHPGLPFPTISGDFRRGEPSPHLMFIVNDILTQEEFDTGFSDVEYALRMGRQDDAVPMMAESRSVFQEAETFLDDTWSNALDEAVRWKNEGGYDGAILRDPEGTWTRGTVKNGEIIKVKPVMSLDVMILNVTEAVGEKTGRPVYTITVTYKGMLSDVGSGMPHTLPADLVPGAIAEVECMGLTEDGRLREPRFKGIRHDKVAADN